jgi:hypothetical protein
MAFLALLPLSGAALADFDYSFVEGSYTQIDIDELGDGDGFGFGGSYGLTDGVYLFGNFESGEVEVDLGAPLGSLDVDVDRFKVGFGFHAPLSDSVDLVASAAYLDVDLSVIDDTGYEAGVGLRGMASPALELFGGISYADAGDIIDGETSFSAGFLYYFSDAFAMGVGGSFGDDMSTYALNGRVSFGE